MSTDRFIDADDEGCLDDEIQQDIRALRTVSGRELKHRVTAALAHFAAEMEVESVGEAVAPILTAVMGALKDAATGVGRALSTASPASTTGRVETSTD